jgi:hypothetical protein
MAVKAEDVKEVGLRETLAPAPSSIQISATRI